MHFQGPNTVEETLHCPGILGKNFLQVVFSTSIKTNCFRCGNFVVNYGFFGLKIAQKNAFPGCYNFFFFGQPGCPISLQSNRLSSFGHFSL